MRIEMCIVQSKRSCWEKGIGAGQDTILPNIQTLRGFFLESGWGGHWKGIFMAQTFDLSLGARS